MPSLERIARISHRDSRFYQDGRFDRARCDDLFAAWILESCRGYADAVLAAERNGEAVGYITAHLEPEGRGRIGLTGVAPDVRDRGVGRTLVAGILDWFRGHGINRVSVATQGRNTRAIRLYERSGFVVSDIALWYHRWTEQPAHD